MALELYTREQQELAQDMMTLESKVHHFARQILASGELLEFQGLIDEFNEKIAEEPYATIYATNSPSGATLAAVSGIYDDLKAFSDTLNADQDVIDICEHVEG